MDLDQLMQALAERLAPVMCDAAGDTDMDCLSDVATAIAADEVLVGIMRYAICDTIDSPAKQMAFAPLTREVDPTS